MENRKRKIEEHRLELALDVKRKRISTNSPSGNYLAYMSGLSNAFSLETSGNLSELDTNAPPSSDITARGGREDATTPGSSTATSTIINTETSFTAPVDIEACIAETMALFGYSGADFLEDGNKNDHSVVTRRPSLSRETTPRSPRTATTTIVHTETRSDVIILDDYIPRAERILRENEKKAGHPKATRPSCLNTAPRSSEVTPSIVHTESRRPVVVNLESPISDAMKSSNSHVAELNGNGKKADHWKKTISLKLRVANPTASRSSVVTPSIVHTETRRSDVNRGVPTASIVAKLLPGDSNGKEDDHLKTTRRLSLNHATTSKAMPTTAEPRRDPANSNSSIPVATEMPRFPAAELPEGNNGPEADQSELAKAPTSAPKSPERKVVHSLPVFALPELDSEQHLDSLSFYAKEIFERTIRAPEFLGVPAEGEEEVLANPANIFRMVSYDVLSQATIKTNSRCFSYKQSYPEYYQWERRWALISAELANFKSDIYCLQSVEKSKFADYFEKFLVTERTYQCFYTCRGGEKNDGCAIFWDPKKFEELARDEINLNYHIADLDKPNVAQILLLKHVKAGKELLVVNTRLHYNPNNGIVKLNQLAVILANMDKMRTNNQPIIFCGNFNFEPNSSLFKFMTQGSFSLFGSSVYTSGMSKQRMRRARDDQLVQSIPLPARLSDKCTFLKKDEERIAGMPVTTLRHQFKFHSVYPNEVKYAASFFSGHSPKERPGQTDYIFYSVKKVEPLKNKKKNKLITESDLFLFRRLALPTEKNLIRSTTSSVALPCEYQGSDHLPLLADFFFR